jgi:hypothetical protein
MNYKQRENLKRKVEADLQLLIDESWLIDVEDKLKNILEELKQTTLEGYDD